MILHHLQKKKLKQLSKWQRDSQELKEWEVWCNLDRNSKVRRLLQFNRTSSISSKLLIMQNYLLKQRMRRCLNQKKTLSINRMISTWIIEINNNTSISKIIQTYLTKESKILNQARMRTHTKMTLPPIMIIRVKVLKTVQISKIIANSNTIRSLNLATNLQCHPLS